MDKLPVFQMVIDESVTSDIEVAAVAFVDKPAIEKNFLAFDSHQLHFDLNEEQRIVSGPAMVADQLIYRRDENGEYNVFFSADTIRQINLKFFKKGYQKNLNLFHDPTLALEGVTIFESFVSDKARGVQPLAAFKDLPDGTWFISAKVENDIVWSKIKSGEVKGFSVEGIFSYMKKGENRTGQHNAHVKGINDSLMADVKELIATLKQTFIGPAPVVPAVNPAPAQVLNTDFTLKDGTAVSIDKLEVGGVVLMNGAPATAGEYELQDGTKLTVADGGVISLVATVQTPADPNTSPDYSAQFADYDLKFKEYGEKFSTYEAKFTAYEERFTAQEAQINNANTTIVKLMNIVEQLAAAPTADPIGDPKPSFSAQQVQSKEQRREAFIKTIHDLKNKK